MFVPFLRCKGRQQSRIWHFPARCFIGWGIFNLKSQSHSLCQMLHREAVQDFSCQHFLNPSFPWLAHCSVSEGHQSPAFPCLSWTLGKAEQWGQGEGRNATWVFFKLQLYKTFLCFFFFFSLQLKEMCRRELDKAESEIKKNSSIIGDYKQVSTTSCWCGLLSKYKAFRYFRRFLEISAIYAMHLRTQFSCSKREACGWFCIFFGQDPDVVSPVWPWCGYL